MSIGLDEKPDDELLQEIRETYAEEDSNSFQFQGGEKYAKYETLEDAMEDIHCTLPRLIKRAEIEKFDWQSTV
jgi:hypothetical protein